MRTLALRVPYSVGVDLFWPYLVEARRFDSHSAYVACDARKLPFRPMSFDVVVCLEVLEHLTKAEGLTLLNDLESIALRRVILTTPAVHYEQHAYDDNPHQAHQSFWSIEEIEDLGFRVRTYGLRWLTGLAGVQSPLPRVLHPLVRLAWAFAGPLVWVFPRLGGAMVCIKDVR